MRQLILETVRRTRERDEARGREREVNEPERARKSKKGGAATITGRKLRTVYRRFMASFREMNFARVQRALVATSC